MSVDDRARQRQPEAGSVRGRIEPDSDIEDAVELVRRDPGSTVGYRYQDSARSLGPYRHEALRRTVHQRVCNEIVECLPKAGRIGVDRR